MAGTGIAVSASVRKAHLSDDFKARYRQLLGARKTLVADQAKVLGELDAETGAMKVNVTAWTEGGVTPDDVTSIEKEV